MSEAAPGPTPALQRAVRRVESTIAAVSRGAAAVAGAACLATLAMICYAVAMRYFFNRPQGWTDEAVGWFIVVAVMFAVPEAQRRNEHIGVDALINRAGPGLRRALLVFGVITVLITAVILVREGWEMVAFSQMLGLKSIGIPEVSLWVVQIFVPLGAILLLTVALGQLFCLLVGLEPEGPDPDALDTHE
jgi:TRAP-type C4-dicarboxylate transport system permease small subunit